MLMMHVRLSVEMCSIVFPLASDGLMGRTSMEHLRPDSNHLFSHDLMDLFSQDLTD